MLARLHSGFHAPLICEVQLPTNDKPPLPATAAVSLLSGFTESSVQNTCPRPLVAGPPGTSIQPHYMVILS